MQIRHQKELFKVSFSDTIGKKERDNFLFGFRRDIEHGIVGGKVILENGGVAEFKKVRT